MFHLSPDDLVGYVMGALDEASSARVETHALRCEGCAARLAAEARLEVSLLEVGAGLEPAAQVWSLAERRRRRVQAAAWSAVGVLAAATLLIILSSERATPLGKEPTVNRCTDPNQAASCIARSAFDGVISIGPDRQLIVPRYDTPASTP
jgi:hypothetical protein